MGKSCNEGKNHPMFGKHLSEETRAKISKAHLGVLRKGGRCQQTKGYILIKSYNHPYKNKQNNVYEHRLVMEKHLGRILLPTEIVHHINGDVSDNRIENLMLFSSRSTHQYHHENLKRNLAHREV